MMFMFCAFFFIFFRKGCFEGWEEGLRRSFEGGIRGASKRELRRGELQRWASKGSKAASVLARGWASKGEHRKVLSDHGVTQIWLFDMFYIEARVRIYFWNFKELNFLELFLDAYVPGATFYRHQSHWNVRRLSPGGNIVCKEFSAGTLNVVSELWRWSLEAKEKCRSVFVFALLCILKASSQK